MLRHLSDADCSMTPAHEASVTALVCPAVMRSAQLKGDMSEKEGADREPALCSPARYHGDIRCLTKLFHTLLRD